MEKDTKNQNGLKNKLYDGVIPHKMRYLIEKWFTKNWKQVDTEVLC